MELKEKVNCAIINGELYKKIIFTKEQLQAKIPQGAIACQNPDEKSGHWPHWVKCNRNNPEDKYHWEGFDDYVADQEFDTDWCLDLKAGDIDGIYELRGPKIQGNPEGFKNHTLIPL